MRRHQRGWIVRTAVATAALTVAGATLVVGAPVTAAIAADTTVASDGGAFGTTTTPPQDAGGRTIQETEIAGANSTIIGEAEGPAIDHGEVYIADDGTVYQMHDSGVAPSSFSLGGPTATSGPTFVGASSDGGPIFVGDRGDDSVRMITDFGKTTRIPLDVTPTDVQFDGRSAAWVTSDDDTLVNVDTAGTATDVHIDADGGSAGMTTSTTEDSSNETDVIVPGDPHVWVVDQSVQQGFTVRSFTLPDGLTPTTLVTGSDPVGSMLVGLSDGDFMELSSTGGVLEHWTNSQPGAHIEQYQGGWFRETYDGMSEVGYIDHSGFHVIDAHPSNVEEAVSLFGIGDGWVGWKATGAGGRDELEDLSFVGTRTVFPLPTRTGSDSSTSWIDGTGATPAFGTHDGRLGFVNAFTTTRVSGVNRVQTNIAEANAAFPNGASTVFVASAASFPDALAAGPAAAKVGAPVLLSQAAGVYGDVLDEIGRLGAKRIVIVGGDAAIGQHAEAQLAQAVGSAHVVRLGGSNRVATSELVARWAFGSSGAKQAMVVTGWSFPDALTAGAAIGTQGPVLLVNGETGHLGADTTATLKSLGVTTTTIAGGTSAVPASIERGIAASGQDVRRVAGADRYDTADALASAFHPTSTNALMATGKTFADALGGAAWAAHADEPLLLAPQTCVEPDTLQTEALTQVQDVTLLGGPDALTSQNLEYQYACEWSTFPPQDGTF
jgi:putative cell wall-binding protein